MRVQDNQQYKAHIIWFSHTLDLPVDLWTSGPQLGTWPARAVDQWSPSETMEEFCPMIYTPTLRTTGPLDQMDQWASAGDMACKASRPMGLTWDHGRLSPYDFYTYLTYHWTTGPMDQWASAGDMGYSSSRPMGLRYLLIVVWSSQFSTWIL